MAILTKCRIFTLSIAALAAIATLWLSSPAAMAGSSGIWTISKMSGQVDIIKAGASPVALTTGDELRPGDMIETAADSSAILVRNGESIVIAPNSRMGLPARNDSAFSTLILQQFGSLLLKVEKQQRQHFEVKTPYLAAVVKGTTFTVNVDPMGASVHVIEGAVQVANQTGMMALVRPGQTAKVPSAPGADLSVQGAAPNAPTQRSDNGQNPDTAGHGDAAGKPASTETASVNASSPAATAATASFVIENKIGAGDIDIAKATNGLIQSVQAPIQASTVNLGQIVDATKIAGTSNSVATTGSSIGGSGITGSTSSTSLSSVTGSVSSSVTGGVSSVTGTVGSVTGTVGSVTGTVGSVAGSVGSVAGSVASSVPTAPSGGSLVGTVVSGVTGIIPATTSTVAQTVASLGGLLGGGK